MCHNESFGIIFLGVNQAIGPMSRENSPSFPGPHFLKILVWNDLKSYSKVLIIFVGTPSRTLDNLLLQSHPPRQLPYPCGTANLGIQTLN